jgi:PAS domain S-box-containing protein
MVTRLGALADASARIFSAPSLADALRVMTEEARRIIGAHQCVTSLTVGADSAQAIQSVSFSEKYAAWRGFDAKPSGKGIYALVCRENRPIRLTQAELEAHPGWRGSGAVAGRHPPLRGWLAAPLVGRDGGNVGLIQLSDRHEGEFDQDDEAILVSLARLAAVAVENVRLMEAARSSEQRFLGFAEIASDWLWETDAEHRFTFFAGTSGTLDERPYGRRRWEIAGAEAEDPNWEAHLADLEARRPFRAFEYRRRDGSGRLRHISVSGNPLFSADGRFIGYRGVTTDVTGQREAEAAARAAADRYRTIVETANEGIWILDADVRTTFVNRRMAEMLGYAPEEILGRSVYDFRPPEDRVAREARWSERRRGVAEQREARFMRRDGSVFWALVNAQPQFAADGAFAGSLGMVTDITERKAAETALKASQDRFRDFAQIGSEVLWETDAEHRYTLFLAKDTFRLHRPPEWFIGRTRWEAVGAAADDPAWAPHIADLEARRPIRNFEYPARRKNGAQHHLRVSADPIFDREGRFAGYRGATQDVTDLRRAEAVARASEDRFRDFAEIASDWMWETDAEHRLTYISGRTLPIDNDPFGRTRWDLAGAGADDPDWRGHIADLDARRPFRDFEFTVRSRSGRVHHLAASGRPRFDPEGRFLGYRGTTTNRTAQRLAEAAARESERKFRQIVETAHEGIWMLDGERRTTYVNPRMAELLGYAAEEMIGHPHWDFMAAGDRESAIEDMRNRRPGEVEKLELRYLRKDGRPLWALVTSNVVEDPESGATRVLGMLADITDRKEAEERAARSEQELRAALEQNRSVLASISDGFVAFDNEWRFTFVNAAAERLGGRKAEELLGKPLPELGVGHDNTFFACYRESKNSGEPLALVAYSDIFGKWIDVRGYPHPGGYTLFFQDVSEERRAHRALLKSLRKLEAAREMNFRIFETSRDLICITDRAGTFVQMNSGAASQFGYAPEELVGRNASEFIEADGMEATRAAMRSARRTGAQQTFENRCLRKDGRQVPVNWSVTWSEGEQRYFLIGRDISERVAAEERLHRAQRLEAVGQLTGGIAHDFNNLLTVIMGNSDMLVRALGDRATLRRQAELSLEAARRAADLTAQLLAFARRQTLAPKAVEPNRLILDMRELIRRTIGAHIDIALRLAERPWRCKVDSTQLETALLNLALNARDAMPEGGTLTMATSHRTIEAVGNGMAADLPPGDYVVIDVSDTGTGMSPEVLERVFEPFYTTKGIGKGSGLGLAMVYGFVKQSGGHVAIQSEPGRGTVVSLLFPRAAEDAAAVAANRNEDTPLPGGGETILVVEDDPAVRELVTAALARMGYRVLVAGNGSTARNVLYGGEAVDLLFTDIMMPGGITGTQLAAEAGQRLPGLRILFTSGYSDMPTLTGTPAKPGAALLRKPYKMRELALAVRRALDRAA